MKKKFLIFILLVGFIYAACSYCFFLANQDSDFISERGEVPHLMQNEVIEIVSNTYPADLVQQIGYPLSAGSELSTAKADEVERSMDTEETQPSWYSKPPYPLPITVYSYARVHEPLSPIFTNLLDAVNGTGEYNRSPDSPLVYVSYSDYVQIGGKIYYRVGADKWMTEDEITPESYSSFSGLVFDQPLDFNFGWVIEDRNSIKFDPNNGDLLQGNAYTRYDVRQVLSIQDHDGVIYYEIDPGEWMPEESFSFMDTSVEVPDRVKNCRWIKVSLSQQNIAFYDNCQLVFATLISSGRNQGWTMPGSYRIERKEEYITLTDLNPGDPDSYYLQDVPWVMFYAGSWAIHSAYWHDNFGSPYSHGCITLSPVDARYLYSHVKWGDVLVIDE